MQVIHALENLKIQESNRRSLILATLDVKTLYPSISHCQGVILALQQAMPTRPPIPTDHPMKLMLREILMHILYGNTFEYVAGHFWQIKGVAMGTPVAPMLANLFMEKV